MKYDFTTIMDRRGKDAIAVDLPGKGGGFAPGGPKEGFDLIPMWVADMNFATAPSIIEAIQKRISHRLSDILDRQTLISMRLSTGRKCGMGLKG